MLSRSPAKNRRAFKAGSLEEKIMKSLTGELILHVFCGRCEILLIALFSCLLFLLFSRKPRIFFREKFFTFVYRKVSWTECVGCNQWRMTEDSIGLMHKIKFDVNRPRLASEETLNSNQFAWGKFQFILHIFSSTSLISLLSSSQFSVWCFCFHKLSEAKRARK